MTSWVPAQRERARKVDQLSETDATCDARQISHLCETLCEHPLTARTAPRTRSHDDGDDH